MWPVAQKIGNAPSRVPHLFRLCSALVEGRRVASRGSAVVDQGEACLDEIPKGFEALKVESRGWR